MLDLLCLLAVLVGTSALPVGCGPSEQPQAAALPAPGGLDGSGSGPGQPDTAIPSGPSAAGERTDDAGESVSMDPPTDPLVDPPRPDPISSSWAPNSNPDGPVNPDNLLLHTPRNLTARDAGNERDVELRWSVESANQQAFMIQRQHWWGEVWVDSDTLVAPPFPYVFVDSPGDGLWRYRIAAADQDGTSDPTTWAEVRVTSSWTTFTPSADTRIVYVSSSTGNDSNNGLSPFTPKATINAGRALLRTGYPDWILFNRGDTFSQSGWEVGGYGGRSATEPQVWGSYGDGPRPIFTPPPGSGADGFRFNWSPSNIAVLGLHIQAESTGGGSGVSLISSSQGNTNILLEDCFITGFKDNINIQGSESHRIRNVIIRRCSVVDAFPNGGAHSQGAFINYVDGLLIEECVFDHNGWRNSDRSDATIFNHNLYISSGNSGNAIIRRNIIARASSHGLQLRCGGVIEDNLFLLNPIAAQLGGGDPDANTHTSGVTGRMEGNVVLHGVDINASNPRGMGMLCYNIGMQGAVIRGNIVAHNTPATDANAIPLYLWTNSYGCGVGNNNLAISNNVFYHWRGPITILPPVASPPSPSAFTSMSGVVFEDNEVQLPTASSSSANAIYVGFASTPGAITFRNNTYWTHLPAGQQLRYNSTAMSLAQWASATGDTGSQVAQLTYLDAARTIATYSQSIGGAGTAEDFLASARLQQRGSWLAEYAAGAAIEYFRDGYSRVP